MTDAEVSKISKGTNIMKRLFGSHIVESFRFRTCVNPKITKESGGTEIIYESLTAQERFQNVYSYPVFSKFDPFIERL